MQHFSITTEPLGRLTVGSEGSIFYSYIDKIGIRDRLRTSHWSHPVALGPCAKIAGEWLQQVTGSHSRHNLAVEPPVCARSESYWVALVARAQPV
jgi:hypothetical protein